MARRKATVAAEITGKVVELFVDEGMVVRRGQIVAQLDSVLAETDLTLAQSRAVAAEAAATAIAADLRDAERILGRVQSLSQKNVASEADLTKAEARVGVLRAQLGQAQANPKPRGSMRSAPRRCSTSTGFARRSEVSSWNAALSRAR